MVKYVITEMGFEGKIPENYENMRVLEAQIVAVKVGQPNVNDQRQNHNLIFRRNYWN